MLQSARAELPHWITGQIGTAVGAVPCVATTLQIEDRVGALRARLGASRMHYSVPPGLYAVGEPGPDSPVFVSANYKMSFDALRSALTGRSGWIMVLDTRGINVWCAAGEGTFSTDEVVRRAAATVVGAVAPQGIFILPQLSATGVAAHEVRRRTGHRTVFGPVRARDLPAFLEAGMRATPAMRRVTFGIADRAVLVPIELVNLPWMFWAALVALSVLAGFSREGYSLQLALAHGPTALLLGLLGYLGGAVITPILLPWLPGRMFSTRGAFVGLIIALANLAVRYHAVGASALNLDTVSWFAIFPSVSAFLAMNFTGASTFTSLSGVKREIKLAMPLELAGAALGLILWIVARFF